MDDRTSDQHWSDSQAGATIERGKAKLSAEPRAVAARYDAAADRVIIDLTSGATFAFPPALVEFLQDATPEQLAEVEVQGAGFGLGDAERRLHRARPDERRLRYGALDGRAGRSGHIECQCVRIARDCRRSG